MTEVGRVLYIIEIDGEYWHRFKTRPMGRWVRDIRKATPMTRALAASYIKDWKPYGARMVPIGETPR